MDNKFNKKFNQYDQNIEKDNDEIKTQDEKQNTTYKKIQEENHELDEKIQKLEELEKTKEPLKHSQPHYKDFEMKSAEDIADLKKQPEQFKQETNQRFNNQDERMNGIDRRITVVNEHMLFSLKQMNNLLEEVARNTEVQVAHMKSEDLLPPIDKNEEAFLLNLVKDGLDEEHPLVTECEGTLKALKSESINLIKIPQKLITK